MFGWTSRRDVLAPALVGLVALVAATVLGYVTIRDTAGADPTSAEAARTEPAADPPPAGADAGDSDLPGADSGTGTSRPVPTRRLVSRPGGFAVAVPRGLEVSRVAGTLRLTRPDRTLAVVVGRAGPGGLERAERRLLSRMREEYRRLRVLGSEPTRVDGRRGRTVFGQAVNSSGTRLRYAVITVHAGNRNFNIAAYTAHDADPAVVLPQVNAVANGFEVLARRG